uniref:Uncharacterized protein n=1 Tax=Anguilla anguilla TaxID=7936 RepID=A0A0E9T0C9_ANGAN
MNMRISNDPCLFILYNRSALNWAPILLVLQRVQLLQC